MKKALFFVYIFFVICIPLFSAEIIISPNAGASVYTVHGSSEILDSGRPEHSVLSKRAVTYTMAVPSIGLDMHFIHERNGFTFSVINNAGFPVALFKQGGFGNDKRRIAGFIWDGQALFGYTYGVKQPLSIRFGIGPGLALGRFLTIRNTQRLENFYHAWTLTALHFSMQYVFTRHIGISFGIYDMLGFSGLMLGNTANLADDNARIDGAVGLGNVFTLKLGIVFRF